MYGMKRTSYRILVGNTEGKWPLGRPRWDDIKMDFRKIGWGVIDWSSLPYDKDQWGFF